MNILSSLKASRDTTLSFSHYKVEARASRTRVRDTTTFDCIEIAITIYWIESRRRFTPYVQLVGEELLYQQISPIARKKNLYWVQSRSVGGYIT